ncbi:type II toxin-antitoxin system VapC family toxin [Pseudomonas putida]|uniref:Type II toxin-antitoxin system VapC family toxin n=1 Tax=Pseudomonas putida TaxID=303 RepID=A0A8I1JGX1_PSEPU|nr:type II toxin-antitoxin system VapC family toxin [Pseudomonas putida]
MKLLLDTHMLIWAATNDPKLSYEAALLIENPVNEVFFSAASIWEMTIKADKLPIDPGIFRTSLLRNGYKELSVSSEHALGVRLLPDIHKDPFDRIMIAQANVEGITFLTQDGNALKYPGVRSAKEITNFKIVK